MGSSFPGPPGGAAAKAFATTHWSVVAQAGDNSPAASDALEKLCSVYWYPVYAEVRRRGHGPQDAQDLTQEFFACLLRRNSFASANKSKGRFRCYLLGALNHFLADQRERENTQKRGGGFVIISLDAEEAEGRYGLEGITSESPESLFDRRWRVTLLDESFARLREEYVSAGKEALFERLKPFLAVEVPPGGYERSAAESGMKAPTFAAAVFRMRQRYAAIVRAIASETLANPGDVEDELRQLFS